MRNNRLLKYIKFIFIIYCMGSVFSNISQSMPSMPNMSGVKSYFDPTAPPQGFQILDLQLQLKVQL